MEKSVIRPPWSFSESYVPESGWSPCRIHVTQGSIKGVFRAAGLHLGPGVNAAAGTGKTGRRHTTF